MPVSGFTLKDSCVGFVLLPDACSFNFGGSLAAVGWRNKMKPLFICNVCTLSKNASCLVFSQTQFAIQDCMKGQANENSMQVVSQNHPRVIVYTYMHHRKFILTSGKLSF